MLKVTANMQKDERVLIWDSPDDRIQKTLLCGGIMCSGSSWRGSWEDQQVDRYHHSARTVDTLAPLGSKKARSARSECVLTNSG